MIQATLNFSSFALDEEVDSLMLLLKNAEELALKLY
jgi:hypothetical protein